MTPVVTQFQVRNDSLSEDGRIAGMLAPGLDYLLKALQVEAEQDGNERRKAEHTRKQQSVAPTAQSVS